VYRDSKLIPPRPALPGVAEKIRELADLSFEKIRI
jgi:hypothetical protein